jgi:hypothetical protein
MSEIEVGDYVRTETGFIRRIKSIDKTEATEKCPVNMYWCNLDKPIKILKECSKDTIYAIEMSDAKKLKHFNNILDLIEVKDVIKYRINNISTTLETKGYVEGIVDISNKEMLQRIKNDKNYEVLEILTHQQYMANCYKVGGEDE